MNKKIDKCRIKQIRQRYEERLNAIFDVVKDVVPLKMRVDFKRRKLRLFDAVVNRQGKKPPQRGKLAISETEWFGIYQTL